MNTYTIDFFGQCPTNGARITYTLKISTGETIPVEEIIAATDALDGMYHEEIADSMLERFKGIQTLSANHHGVHIETTRPHIAHWSK